MKRAYWDMVKKQAAEGEYKTMLDNLREVKERLRMFLPVSRKDMRDALEANFDIDFLEQQLTHRAFDADSLTTLLDVAIGTILELEAPVRTESTQVPVGFSWGRGKRHEHSGIGLLRAPSRSEWIATAWTLWMVTGVTFQTT